MRSLSPFPIYSFAGAVDGGNWRGEDASGDCSNIGAVRSGVGGFPGVLSTKVCILLRPGGIVSTTLIVSSSTCFWASVSALSASFSVASGPISDRIEALLWVLMGLAYFGFWILSGSRLGNKSSSIICSAKLNKALLILTIYSSKRVLVRFIKPFLISIIWFPRLKISLDYNSWLLREIL